MEEKKKKPVKPETELSAEVLKELTTELEAENPELLEKISEQGRIKIVQGIIQRVSVHSGPLPPGPLFETYCKHIPNGGDRFMGLVEKQSAHRQKMEEKMADAEITSRYWGMRIAFILTILSLGSALYLSLKGRPVEAVSAILIAVLSYLTSLGGRKKEDKED